MRFSSVSALVLAVAPLAFTSPAPSPETLDLAESAAAVELAQNDAAASILQFLEEKEEAAVRKRTTVQGCSLSTLKVRKELYVDLFCCRYSRD